MTKRFVLGALLPLVVAGCNSDPQVSVNGLALTVKDQLYISRPAGNFCDFAPMGQITIKMVDYSPACALDRQSNDPDPRVATEEHTELDIVLGGLFAGGAHENLRDPFSLSKFDCVNGPGDNGTAYFYHFAPNAMAPDKTVQVDSGTVLLTQFDKTNAKAVKGTFDLTFAGDKVTGTIDALNCDM
jgi:hypothetical protein